MSSTINPCARQIKFAGEVRTFNLNDSTVLATIAGGQDLRNLQLLMKFGGRRPLGGQFGDTPAACLRRFLEQVYSVSDIENVIALGLIGGGMAADEAFQLVKEQVTGKPLAGNALIASEVISALFVGAAEAA
ncbi:Phage tail tube protein, GTA-gp10 [Bradyrhizobium sp. Rc3b]|uniref:GTA-gp10 family protein n=1 Tax=Bradyrhizobium sp. Rc3b TaxID=1855322 RepID=UPI0008F35382|nr:GTA-gp10 family protein [Bradyrhizobium sp. Rc3b]SFN02463.1 Phage tail tube protein, GTA-gp10 [Bradyrhizobium sp. Rc3b]